MLGFGPFGRTDGWTDRQIPPVFYRTLSPSGPLPKNDTQNDISVSYFYSMRLPELQRGGLETSVFKAKLLAKTPPAKQKEEMM